MTIMTDEQFDLVTDTQQAILEGQVDILKALREISTCIDALASSTRAEPGAPESLEAQHQRLKNKAEMEAEIDDETEEDCDLY